MVAAANGPEVMVVIFGGNDAQPLQLADGKVYDVTDQPWQDEYRRRVGATMDLLGAAGRKVIWVGPPNAKSTTFTGRLAVLSQIYSEEAAKRPDTIVFLDSRILFSDAKGGIHGLSSGRLGQAGPDADPGRIPPVDRRRQPPRPRHLHPAPSPRPRPQFVGLSRFESTWATKTKQFTFLGGFSRSSRRRTRSGGPRPDCPGSR